VPPTALDRNEYQPSQREFEQGYGGLVRKLLLGSHLARYIREEIESKMGGCTCSAGISTSKVLSKLVGSEHKPRNQTTLLPPYEMTVPAFLKDMEIRRIPGIGFKSASKLQEWYLKRPLEFKEWELETRDAVTIGDFISSPRANTATLELILSAPGAPRGIGETTWNLLHGVDNTEVAAIRNIPKQISIEDSYSRLDNLGTVKSELSKLATALVTRMRVDLLSPSQKPHWLAKPRTLKLSTRPRLKADDPGMATYLHNRISRSTAIPSYVFSLSLETRTIAERLVREPLIFLFRQLHSEQTGWNLSLLNIAVTNMDEVVEGGKGDIVGMFKRLSESDGLRSNANLPISRQSHDTETFETGSEDFPLQPTQQSQVSASEESRKEDKTEDFEDTLVCQICGNRMPLFALTAHERFHGLGKQYAEDEITHDTHIFH
jgi:DNA polymerase iota